MKKFLVCVCSIFLMFSFSACSNGDVKTVNSANVLVKKLESKSDAKIEISGDLVINEPIKILGNKEILGNGTLRITTENMKEAYMLNVSDGASLTLGGKVVLNLSGLSGGVSVNKDAVFTFQDEAVIQEASSKTANVLTEGRFHMNGGTVTNGYHNVICTGASMFTWNAGTVSNSDNDGIVVGEKAEISITSADALFTGSAARGLRLDGEGVIENATMKDSMDSMIKVGPKGKLTLKNGKISDAGLHGIDNAGELLVTGGTIFENYNSGICNTGTFEMTGGTVMNNKNKGVLNKSGSAKIVSAAVVLTGNTFAVGNEEGAYFELAKAKLMQSATTNVYAYGGEMYIHDIVLATSGSNNIRIVAAKVKLEDTEIKGVNKGGSRTMHGLLLEGGSVAVKNLTIENTTGNGIRNKGGKITGENVTIKDINNIGIGNVNQDVTGRDGIIELTNVTVENVKSNNVLVEGGVCKLTNATLERCATNNIKVSEGKLVLKNSVVNGNVAGIKNNNHAVYMVGGIFEAGNVKIQNSAGAILRINGEKALFNGKNITFRNAGTIGIHQTIGQVKIDGLLSQNVKDNNVYMEKGTVDLKNATLCKTHNNNIRMTKEGSLKLTNVEIQGTADGVKETVHGLFVSKGTTTAKNLTIRDVKAAAIRVNGETKLDLEGVKILDPGVLGIQINGGMTEIAGLITSGVPGNNIHMYDAGKLVLKDSVLGECKDNSIKTDHKSVLSLEGVTLKGHTKDAKEGVHGIYALAESKIIAKDLRIENVSGAAVRTTGNPNLLLQDTEVSSAKIYGFRLGGGTVKVENLTTEGVGDNNFLVEGKEANLTVKGAVLCPTKNNNVRISNGTTRFEDTEILGHVEGVKETVHGFFASKGTTTVRNLTIKNARVAALRVSGNAKLDIEGIKIQDPGVLGVQINGGMTEIAGLTTSGVPGNNIQMYDAGKLVLKDSLLGECKDNSIKTDHKSVLSLEGVTLKGHTKDAKEGVHGIYALAESKIIAKDLRIENVSGAAVRTTGNPNLLLQDTEVSSAKIYGFRLGGGTVKVENLTTEGVGDNNFLVEGKEADLMVKGAVLCPTKNNNVRISNGTTRFEDTEILGHAEGVTAMVHGFFVSNGTATVHNLVIRDAYKSAMRVSGGNVVAEDVTILNVGDCAINANGGITKITGLTTSDIKANNVYMGDTGRVILNDSVLGATGKENIKQTGNSELTLNGVTLNGVIGKNGYILCTNGKKATLNHVVIDDADKNDYVGIWLDKDACEVTGKDVSVKNMQYGMIGSKGKAEITGMIGNASVQNMYVKKATVVINSLEKLGSVFEKTKDNNVKVEGGQLSLSGVIVKGSTQANSNGIFVLGSGKLEADEVQIQDSQANAFRVKGNGEVKVENTTVSGGINGIYINEQAKVYLTGFTAENVKTNGISMEGNATVVLKDSALRKSIDAAGYAVCINGGTAVVENLNKEITEVAVIYNKSADLKLAGTLNASIYNDAAITVGASKALNGNQMTIDWAEGKIPSNMIGIQFANEEDASISKGAVKFGEIAANKYIPYFYGSQMLLNDKNKLNYTVKNYDELEKALENIEENNVSDATITLAGDIIIPQTITINENRSISIQDDGTARKILRADSYAPAGTRGVLFDVNANASLTFRSTGNDKDPKLTIDGNKANTKATGNWAIVNAKADSIGVNVYEGVQFLNNSSSGSGSAICMEKDSGSLRIEGGQFKNNISTNIGGAINIATSAQATIRNAVFMGNQGSHGGAMIALGGSNVLLENCKFEKNHATGNGGALNAEAKVRDGIVVRNCIFKGNTAASEGGAINVPTACGLTLSDCTFTENIAKKTGFGLVTWGNDIRTGAANSFVNISGRMIVEIFHRSTSCVNVVSALTEGSHVVIDWSTDNGTINRIPQGTKPAIVFDSANVMNASREYISLGKNMVNTDYRLSYNQSEAKAYCAAVTKVSDFSSLKNALSGVQAGVTKTVRLIGDVTMTGTLAVKENTEVVIEDDGTARTILRGTNFNKKARGVFFDVSDGATFTWNPTGTAEKPTIIIDGNKANIQPTNGNWAIIVSLGKKSLVNINEGIEFMNNATTGAGCVVRMQAGTLNINGAAFKDNRAINNYGGVIWLSGGSVANIKNAVFSGNASENRGGGALQICNGTTANIENTVFTNNTAGINGGAICVDGKGTANITDSTFTGNQAKDGGAIYNYGNTMLTGTDKTKALFAGNKANNGTGNGGAIYLHAGTLTGSGYEFANNEPDNIKVREGAVNNYRE